MQRAAAVLLSVALVACYSTSLMQDTRVTPRGAGRVAFGGGVTQSRNRAFNPMFEAAIHVGVDEGLELQGKISSAGAVGVGLKLAVIDAGRPLRLSLLGGAQLALVVIDGAGEVFSTTRTVAGLNAMPMFGLVLTRGVEIVIGPDLQIGTKSGGGAGIEPWLGAGGALAISFDLYANWSFIPECSVLMIAAGPPTRAGEVGFLSDRTVPDSVFARGDVRVQCGASFNLGRPYSKAE
jgi:hypothetical protein